MFRLIVSLVLLLLPSIAVAQDAKRVALVIGNSAYKFAGDLANPRNDAVDLAAVLTKLGFAVIEGFDLDKASFDRKIRDFAVALSGADVGVFYYAGHGLQVAGQNYLVPVDAQAETSAALDFEMVRLDLVHRTMEREAQTNVLFLDACRNNPLSRNLARAMGTRSTEIGRGLAAVESGVGTLISFSTQPGNVALDGGGRNSPFAASLVKRISSSSDDLSALLIDVRNDVRKETGNKQVPWEHSALTGRFYFGVPAVVPAQPTMPHLSEAAQVWATVKETTELPVLEAFAKQFSDTVYGALARARLKELARQRVAIVPPSFQPTIRPPLASATPDSSPLPLPPKNEHSFRLASSFPSAMKEVSEPSQQFVKELHIASAGRLKVQLFAAGQIVPGLQVLDSVSSGSIELGWTPATFYVAKNPAFAAIGGGLPLGIDAATFVRWLEGPGRTLRARVYEEAGGVKSFPCSINGPRGLWVRKELKSLDDLRGLKLRVPPATQLALQPFGVVAQQIAASDIYPALEKGNIDGLEWMTPPMDEKLGWHKAAKFLYYPFGEPTFSSISDLLVNKRVWDELDPSLQNIIEQTCRSQLHNDMAKLDDGVQGALQRMRATGAVISPTPGPISAKYRERVRIDLDQGITSPAGKAAWNSLRSFH